MLHSRVLCAALLSSVTIGAAPAPTPPPITSYACVVGDAWTYRYSGKSNTGAGLNGSETWTRTACTPQYVAHPSGMLIKSDTISDANGNYTAGFSGFTGAAQTYQKPLPLGHLPLAPGTTWDAPVDVDLGSGRGFTGTGHWKAVAWETITVPAGTFLCLRKEVHMDYQFSAASTVKSGASHMTILSGTYDETSWYSPDARADVKSTASDSFGDSAARELTGLALKT